MNCLLEDLDQIHYGNYNTDDEDKRKIGIEALLMLMNIGKWTATWVGEIMKS